MIYLSMIKSRCKFPVRCPQQTIERRCNVHSFICGLSRIPKTTARAFHGLFNSALLIVLLNSSKNKQKHVSRRGLSVTSIVYLLRLTKQIPIGLPLFKSSQSQTSYTPLQAEDLAGSYTRARWAPYLLVCETREGPFGVRDRGLAGRRTRTG